MSNIIPPDISTEDSQLIRDTLGGRHEAFGDLVRKHQNFVMDLALRMLRNREEAEDVIQQVFVEAYRHLADFRHGAQFSTWLYAITLNRARNHLRSRKIRRLVSMDETASESDHRTPLQFPDKAPSPDEIVEKQFNLEWIQQQVESLSSDYKDIFTLHYFQDLPLQEVAKRVGRPIGTVKVYLHRARNELYSRWTKQKGHSPADD